MALRIVETGDDGFMIAGGLDWWDGCTGHSGGEPMSGPTLRGDMLLPDSVKKDPIRQEWFFQRHIFRFV